MTARPASFTSFVIVGICALTGCDLFVSTEGRIARASEGIEQGDYRAAMIDLKNAVEQDPTNSTARLLLAEVSLHLGDAQTAEKELGRAVENGAPTTAYSDLAARIRLALGQPEQLLEQIDQGKLLLQQPTLSSYRGQALVALHRYGEARGAFVHALRSEPSDSVSRIGLSEAQLGLGEREAAKTTLRELLNAEPQNVQAKLALAKTHVALAEFAAARDLLEPMYEAETRLPARQQIVLLALLGECYMARADVNASRKIHASLETLAKDAPVTHMLGARLAMATQDYPAAIARLQTLLLSLPEMTPARFLLGAAHLAQGNLYQAEAHLSRVVQQSPENLEARKLLAQVRLRLEQPEGAMQVLMPAQEDAQSDTAIASMMGLAQLQLGNSVAAIQILEQSAAAHSTDREAQLQLARTYLSASAHGKAEATLRSLSHEASDSRREALLVVAVTAGRGLDSARREVERMLAAYSGEVGVLNVASAFYAQQQEPERARVLIDRALELDPNNVATVLNSARVELAAGNATAAKDRLERLASGDPRNAESRLALAELALRANDFTAAIKWLEEVRARHPTAIQPRLGLLKVYLTEQQAEPARAVVRELDKLAPHNPQVQNTIGLMYLDAGRYDEAGSRFGIAGDADPQNAAYWLNLAKVQLATDKRALARETLQRAYSADPQSLEILSAMSMLDVRDGRRDQAMEKLAEASRRRPNDAMVQVLEGDVHMALKEYEVAAQAYRKAFERQASAMSALKAYRARRLARLPQPMEPLESWLQKQPDDVRMQAVLAEAYEAAGQRERAIARYELVVAKRPASAAVLNNLAWLYYETGNALAEPTAQRAYQLAPNNPLVADTYGWILIERDRVSEGLPILEKASQLSVDNPDITYHYAAALAKAGRENDAQYTLRELVERDTHFHSRADAERLLSTLAAN